MNGSQIEFDDKGYVIRKTIQSNLFDFTEIDEVNRVLLLKRNNQLTREDVIRNRPKLKGLLKTYSSPKNDNEVLFNLQYDFLINGNNNAWGQMLTLASEVTQRLVINYTKENKIYCDDISQLDKASEAMAYVLRRFDAGYVEKLGKKTKPKFMQKYPLGQYYVTTNFIDFLQKGVKHAFLYITKIDANTALMDNVTLNRVRETKQEKEIV